MGSHQSLEPFPQRTGMKQTPEKPGKKRGDRTVRGGRAGYSVVPRATGTLGHPLAQLLLPALPTFSCYWQV